MVENSRKREAKKVKVLFAWRRMFEWVVLLDALISLVCYSSIKQRPPNFYRGNPSPQITTNLRPSAICLSTPSNKSWTSIICQPIYRVVNAASKKQRRYSLYLYQSVEWRCYRYCFWQVEVLTLPLLYEYIYDVTGRHAHSYRSIRLHQVGLCCCAFF